MSEITVCDRCGAEWDGEPPRFDQIVFTHYVISYRGRLCPECGEAFLSSFMGVKL